MIRSRFLWQLGASFGAVIVISTLVFGFVTSSQIQRDTTENIRHSLNVQASLLAHLFAPYLIEKKPISSQGLAEMTEGMDHRVTIIDSRGEVLADNREDSRVMDNHGGRPEILMARSHEVGVSERYSRTLGQNMLYVARAVREDGVLVGFVRVALPLSMIDRQLANLGNRIFSSAALIATLCLALVFYLARRFTRPLSEMTSVATRLAGGEYRLRLPEGRDDEIGRLSRVLNELAKGTEDRIDALTHSRNQLAAVLSGLAEGVIAVDLEQRIVHINDPAREMLSLFNREVTGVPLWEAVRINEIPQAVDTCLQEMISVNATLDLDGRTLDLAAVLLRDQTGETAEGAIVILQDVTEKLHLEKVRSDFVANASHELKTPISAIRGLVETILDDPAMSPEVLRQYVDRISHQARRLDAIVQDLIRLSRFDTRTGNVPMSRVDLCALIARVFHARIEDADEAGVEFQLDVGDGNIEVEGDEQALEQMLINLVDNAFKYTDMEGRVKMTLSRSGGMALVEVEDNGIGIPPDEQQRIFERFYRVDKGRSRELGGTGLGLSIVKHVARSHRGSVSVESVEGAGSVFSVRIPLLDDSNRA